VKVKRVVANVSVSDTAVAKHFYQDILGLEILMDTGWIVRYGSRETMTVQISFLTEGGSGAPVPNVSIEVDDLDAALARMIKAKIPIVYGPADEPWGVRRFFVRDPSGNLLNILSHDRRSSSST
jgi:catechol 2,3-dioxygenase-like lactoylglutathione lyase family enzyme